jgi:hypothetical protein
MYLICCKLGESVANVSSEPNLTSSIECTAIATLPQKLPGVIECDPAHLENVERHTFNPQLVPNPTSNYSLVFENMFSKTLTAGLYE